MNLYGFVGNDGVNVWDRLGWEPQGPTQDRNGSWHAERGSSGGRGGQFITPPSNNVTPSNSIDPSRGVQGGGSNSPSERGSSASTGAGDAIASGAVYISNATRRGADRSARGLAIAECEKLLADSPCSGFRCNSCDVTYRRDFNPDGTALARIFASAVARPCQRCTEERSPGFYSSGGPGLPPRMEEKYPASGLNSAIYVNIPDESFFKWLFNSDQFSFTIENECISI